MWQQIKYNKDKMGLKMKCDKTLDVIAFPERSFLSSVTTFCG